MDQFATLTISEPSVNVDLLSMILQFVKKPIGEKKGENNEETTVPNGEEQITSDQIKTNHGKEQRSIDGNQDKYDKNKSVLDTRSIQMMTIAKVVCYLQKQYVSKTFPEMCSTNKKNTLSISEIITFVQSGGP